MDLTQYFEETKEDPGLKVHDLAEVLTTLETLIRKIFFVRFSCWLTLVMKSFS